MNQQELSQWVDAYIEAQKQSNVDGDHPLWWAIDKFFELMPERPEECWQAILAVLDRTKHKNVLVMLGAGPLEDLIHEHGPAFIDRIESEAGENPAFRDLLCRAWESSTPEVWARVKNARGGV
jgi:hypothetical protein